jgi:hypothetical protein
MCTTVAGADFLNIRKEHHAHHNHPSRGEDVREAEMNQTRGLIV